MEIMYLKKLRDNSSVRDQETDHTETIKPIPSTEIAHLEQLYNSGNSFPKALRELLYLAGDYCYVLDYGLNESQEELQEYVKDNLLEESFVIQRPFYVIDVYNASDQFLFIYLDEGDNPPVYEGIYESSSSNTSRIKVVLNSLSGLIEHRINRKLQGLNPF